LTVQGFTAATGKPVMCAITFSAKEMCASWVLGFNASAPWVGDDNNRRASIGGLDKQYPQELAGVEFGINKEDITYLVSQAWADSFTHVVHNKSAIADCGWNPLNYNCLLHPEIVATRYTGGLAGGSNNASDDREDVMVPAEQGLQVVQLLNLSKGSSGSLIDEILETRAYNNAQNGINLEENQRKRVETAKQIIGAKTKRYSSGLLVAAQQWMTGPDVLNNMEKRFELGNLDVKKSEWTRGKDQVTKYRHTKRRRSKRKITKIITIRVSVVQYRRTSVWRVYRISPLELGGHYWRTRSSFIVELNV
jgi:hypothetical protein